MFVFRCLFVREKPVVDDRLRFDGTVGQTVQTNTGQRIGRFSVEGLFPDEETAEDEFFQ